MDKSANRIMQMLVAMRHLLLLVVIIHKVYPACIPSNYQGQNNQILHRCVSSTKNYQYVSGSISSGSKSAIFNQTNSYNVHKDSKPKYCTCNHCQSGNTLHETQQRGIGQDKQSYFGKHVPYSYNPRYACNCQVLGDSKLCNDITHGGSHVMKNRTLHYHPCGCTKNNNTITTTGPSRAITVTSSSATSTTAASTTKRSTTTTKPSTTIAPTTKASTTAAPTTKASTTAAPTTKASTTAAPTTKASTTAAPTTKASTTTAPTTISSTTKASTTTAPTTKASTAAPRIGALENQESTTAPSTTTATKTVAPRIGALENQESTTAFTTVAPRIGTLEIQESTTAASTTVAITQESTTQAATTEQTTTVPTPIPRFFEPWSFPVNPKHIHFFGNEKHW